MKLYFIYILVFLQVLLCLPSVQGQDNIRGRRLTSSRDFKQFAQVIKGRVLSDRGVPLGKVKVLLAGIKGLEPTTTRQDGSFVLNLPEKTAISSSSPFIVFDSYRLKGKANFDIIIEANGFVNIYVIVPAEKVDKIKVFDENNATISNAEIIIKGKAYTTNGEGIAQTPVDVTNFSIFQAKELYIADLKYIDEGNYMYIYTKNLSANDKEVEVYTRELDEDKKILERSYRVLTERRKNKEAEIDRVKAELESDNISIERRRELEKQLEILQKQLQEEIRRIENAQENAKNLIRGLENTLNIQRKRIGEQEQEIKQQELETENETLKRKNAETSARTAYITFSIIILAVIAIAFVIYVNGRKIRKQKDELTKANDSLEIKINEVNTKNEQLSQAAEILDIKNREIRNKNEQLFSQKEELESTNEQLEETNQKITDSIRYASRIQASTLPSRHYLKQITKDCFVFFKPKDIVSGDFYWTHQRGSELVVIVADCTGHGVPGAFMTMMGKTILDNIVIEQNIYDPAKILTLLHQHVKETLNQEGDEKRDGDGMDVAALKVNKMLNKASFAGAKNPLYYIKDGELFYLKGTNLSIGSTLNEKNKAFENVNFNLEGNETFYLVSDGFQDQRGFDEEGKIKKFMKVKFMNLITEASKYPIVEQKRIFKEAFEAWKKDTEQTDDIVILGLKV